MSAAVGDSIRRRQRRPRPPRPDGRARRRWPRLLLMGLATAAVAFGLGYAVAVLFLFPAPAAAAPGIVVPSLVGQDTLGAARQLAARGLSLGTVTALPDPAVAPGGIVAQDALAGQQLRRGAEVNVAVSTGPARATLPDVTGFPVARAAALLAALGFQASQQAAPSPAAAGNVIAVSPAPGGVYELPAAVLLTVSSGPPPQDSAAVADTAAARDTLGGTGPDRPVSPPPSPPPGSSVRQVPR